jgi:di/tricarboxylate transporter
LVFSILAIAASFLVAAAVCLGGSSMPPGTPLAAKGYGCYIGPQSNHSGEWGKSIAFLLVLAVFRTGVAKVVLLVTSCLHRRKL